MCATLLTDTDAAQRVSAKLAASDRGLWQQVTDKIREWFDGIRKFYSGVDLSSKLAERGRELISRNEAVLNAWVDAAAGAVENYRVEVAKGQKNTANNSGVRNMSRDADIEAENIRKGTSAIQRMIDEARVSDNPESIIEKNVMFRSDIGYIDFKWGKPGNGVKFKRGFGISHIIAKRDFENGTGLETAYKIVEVIAKATKSDLQGNDSISPEYYRLRLHYDNYTAVLVNNGNGNHWLLTGWEENGKAAAYADGEGSDSSIATAVNPIPTRIDGGNATASDGSISPDNEYVKLNSSRDSDYMELAKEPEKNREQLQELVDDAANTAFADSKIRMDEEGDFDDYGDYLMPVYHATDSDFNKFMRGKLGMNTDGNASDDYLAATAHIGFWFNEKDLSEMTGTDKSKTLKGYINAENVAHKSLYEIADEIADMFYSNDGKEYTPAYMGRKYRERLQWDGYDGIVVDDQEMGGKSVVIFESSQFKRSDPVTVNGRGKVIPLSQRFNQKKEDIRYSSREETTRIKEQIMSVADQLNEMDAVAVITTKGFSEKRNSDIAKEVAEEFKKFGNKVDRLNFGSVLIEFNQINKALNYLNTDAEKAALLAVPRVIKRGVLAESHIEHKGRRDLDSFTFAAPVEINGVRGNEGVAVQKASGTNRFKTLRILTPEGKSFELDIKNEADSTTGSKPAKNAGGTPIESASDKKISQPAQTVNENLLNSSRWNTVKRYAFDGFDSPLFSLPKQNRRTSHGFACSRFEWSGGVTVSCVKDSLQQ